MRRRAAAPRCRQRASIRVVFLVTVRRPNRLYETTGLLTAGPDRYEFVYFRCALDSEEFVPLVGFGDTSRRYVRPYLFPLFAERVMSPRRPDRAEYLAELDLQPNASPLEIITRTGGHRHGDAIELVPVPLHRADGAFSGDFLVHGISHLDDDSSEPGRSSRRIGALQQGELLEFRPEPTNPKDPRAVQVLTDDGIEVGWVPGPLTGYVHDVLAGEYRLEVEVAHVPDVPAHLRLLVRLTGWLPEGADPLDRAEWEIVPQ